MFAEPIIVVPPGERVAVLSYAAEASDMPYLFEAYRRGRGWIYRRRWASKTDPWRKTSAKWFAVLIREQRSDWKRGCSPA